MTVTTVTAKWKKNHPRPTLLTTMKAWIKQYLSVGLSDKDADNLNIRVTDILASSLYYWLFPPGPHHDQDPVRAQRGGLDCGGAPLYRGLLAFRLHSLLCGQHAAGGLGLLCVVMILVMVGWLLLTPLLSGDPLLPQLQQLPGKIQGRALRSSQLI